MNKLLQVIAILILSVCSFTSHALSSVKDVENEIAAGNYDHAKTMLKDVIKTHPNSIVAHMYMLQVLDLEYAKTLKPSVEYKVYESGLMASVKALNDAKAKAAKDAEEAADKRRNDRVLSVLKWIGYTLLTGALAFVAWIFYKRYKTRKKEREELAKWVNDTYADIIDINKLAQNMLEKINDHPNMFIKEVIEMVHAIDEDNQDVQKCLDAGDFNKLAVTTHVRNAYLFFSTHGIKL